MATMSSKRIIVILLIFVVVTGVINITPSTSQLVTQSEVAPRITRDSNLKTEIVSKGEMKFPTSMAFLSPDDILVLEKNEGTVKRIVNGTVLPEPLLDVNVAHKNERGMLGIVIDSKQLFNLTQENKTQKQKPNNLYVFLYYTESMNKDGDDVTEGKEPLGNRLYRYELLNNKLVNPKLLLDLPTNVTGNHNGGKIAIGPDDNIYLTIGDLGILDTGAIPKQIQNFRDGQGPDGSSGILRIDKNGQPVGEGILGKEHPANLYFAYGIRNSFGIDFDPKNGNLWDTENGPYNGDEINLVKPGFNSGWSEVQGIWQLKNQIMQKVFHNISAGLENFNGTGNYSKPEFTWNTTVGVTDIKFLATDKLGANYENDLFVGDFHNGNLYHFDLRKDRMRLFLGEPLKDRVANNTAELGKIIFGKGFGGITDLEVGPDGYLYVLALYFGGRNCDPNLPNEPCVPYTGTNFGTLFRVTPDR
jgi:glucose/arabinose dehydrogenase